MPLYASFPLGTINAEPTAPTTVQSWTSGSEWSDWSEVWWPMPTSPTIQVGDRIFLFGISRQEAAWAKSMTTPTGFSLNINYEAADYLCDIRFVARTVTEADLTSGASVTFGANCRRIDWLIVRNYSGSASFGTSTGASSSTSPLSVPSIPGTETGGVHVVSFTSSGNGATVTSVPAGYAPQYTPPTGWHGGGLWIKSPSDRPTGVLEFAGTASADLGLSGLSFWIHPRST